ncbi:MAG: hypothetical protein ACFFDB_00670 [Promethearchaeota archaeon]
MPTYSQEELNKIQEKKICPVCNLEIKPGSKISFDKVVYYNKDLGKLKSRLIPAHKSCMN